MWDKIKKSLLKLRQGRRGYITVLFVIGETIVMFLFGSQVSNFAGWVVDLIAYTRLCY